MALARGMILEPEPGVRPFLMQRLGVYTEMAKCAAGVNNQTCPSVRAAQLARHGTDEQPEDNFPNSKKQKGFPDRISFPLADCHICEHYHGVVTYECSVSFWDKYEREASAGAISGVGACAPPRS